MSTEILFGVFNVFITVVFGILGYLLKKMIDNIENQVRSMTDSVKSLDNTIREIQTMYSAKNTMLDALSTRVLNLDTDMRSVLSSRDEKKLRIGELEGKVRKLFELYNEMSKELHEIQIEHRNAKCRG